jgi:hypothetical protein
MKTAEEWAKQLVDKCPNENGQKWECEDCLNDIFQSAITEAREETIEDAAKIAYKNCSWTTERMIRNLKEELKDKHAVACSAIEAGIDKSAQLLLEHQKQMINNLITELSTLKTKAVEMAWGAFAAGMSCGVDLIQKDTVAGREKHTKERYQQFLTAQSFLKEGNHG